MKFLEGMQCKFTQTKTEYILEFAPEWPSSNNQLGHAKSHHMEDKSSVSRPEIFHGFHTIRTVEKDLAITELETPKFVMHVENMTKNETRTKDKLKFVNKKLEKLLSSDNNTNNDVREVANPLQHCLFGLKAVLPQTKIVKKCRTSLWELFQKHKMIEEKTEPKSNRRKHTENKYFNLVKTMLKKRSTSPSVGTIDSASADEKQHKILPMLHMVNPKASTISKNSQNLWKSASNSNLGDEDIITFQYMAISETSANHTKSKVCNPVCDDTNWKREYWIKSDAEYLILEL